MFGIEFERGFTIRMEEAMRSIGIICEYNPFHNGHARQLRLARELAGESCALVCLMSGNYVQRGAPAVFPKAVRAEAALRCGADLVLELPVTAALSSAEGFASGAVGILSALGCTELCFGTETEDFGALRRSAEANLDPSFDALLRTELGSGCSYPAARQRALERLGAGAGLRSPNDILAVEYLKALLRQNSAMRPLPIRRAGSYHATELDMENPSATAIRAAIERDCRDEHCSSAIRNECDLPKTNPKIGSLCADKQCLSLQTKSEAAAWRAAVPSCLLDLYESAPIHTWGAGERAVLAILRTLPDAAFEGLPYGAEGLWSRLMKNCRRCASTEEILSQTVSKRYPRTRIQRMLLCAILGLTAEHLAAPAPYARILGFSDTGRSLLREMKPRFPLVNAGERPADAAYWALEWRAAELYSLFSAEGPRPGGEEARQRVFYRSENG